MFRQTLKILNAQNNTMAYAAGLEVKIDFSCHLRFTCLNISNFSLKFHNPKADIFKKDCTILEA